MSGVIAALFFIQQAAASKTGKAAYKGKAINMSNLTGEKAELKFSIEIKRAETGAIENYELVGVIDGEQLQELQNGNDTQHSGS